MWIYIVVVLVIIFIILAIVSYNSFVVLDNRVQEAFSTMDVYLKKRWDLVPNIVEVVKAYTKHEKDTLKEVVELRNAAYSRMTTEEKIKANQQLSGDMNRIMAVAEKYPDLKASENFKDLSNKLAEVEEDIVNARKYYNGAVKNYNNKVGMFPSNILAKVFGYKLKPMFEASAGEKQSIRVEL